MEMPLDDLAFWLEAVDQYLEDPDGSTH